KLFDWKMLRKEKIMFKKSLYKAALAYFGDKVGSQEKRAIAEGIASAARNSAEFERKKALIEKEIRDGTARSRGKLPV
ncbi:hypothetical protein, partial [Neisseria meningitidis]